MSSHFQAIIEHPDIVLIGSGIMVANLAVMLKCLEPRLSIQVIEVTEELAQESSNGWNNAGTGHAGICEVSYTPNRNPDGSIDVSRAISIFEQFEYSKLFWSYTVDRGIVPSALNFLRPVPHIGFVRGNSDVDFLRARYRGMVCHHFFQSMEFTSDPDIIGHWAPLVMRGRGPEPVAATKMNNGTEIDFGVLARSLLNWFHRQDACGIATSHRAISLQSESGVWKVKIRNLRSGEDRVLSTKSVFVGAGGGTLPLLQTTGLHEVAGLCGFPIGGQWLTCDREAIVKQHDSKVYGMTPPSAPSLGGPHLDVRWLEGKKQILFGPFASWTTKYLKNSGSWTDLPRSIKLHNLSTFLNTAVKNRKLVQYLISQGIQSMASRMAALREFYPEAIDEDWKLTQAGIRVQTLKKMDRGKIYFGTEVFTAAGNSLSALLGASPGASVSVNIALEVIRKSFPQLLQSPVCNQRMKEMIPVFDIDIKRAEHAQIFRRFSLIAESTLGIS